MSCAEAVKYLHEFVDKELDEPLHLIIKNHIDHCEECHQRCEFEKGVRALVKAHCINTAAPAYLYDRIIKNLHSVETTSQKHPDKQVIYKQKVTRAWLSPRFYPIAASILFSIAGGIFYYTNYHSNNSLSIVDNAVKNHVVAVNDNLVFNEKTSVVGNINKYLENAVNTKLSNSSALINTEPVSVAGGIPAKPYGTSSPCVVFDKGGNKLSLQVIHNSNFPMRNLEKVRLGAMEFYTGSCRGFNSVLWEEDGVIYCLTSDIDKNEILKFAATLHPY